MAEDEIKYFPEELTVFSTKKDAAYSGDPEGDYVLAKHINDLQDAILRVEKSIGTRSSSSESLVELINDLSKERPMRVDSVGYFTGNLTTDMSYTESILGQYKLVLLENKSNQLIPMLASLKEKDTAVYGIIDATDSLVSIQNEIALWKQLGVAGVFLKDFGGEESPTRAHQQNIIDSVEQEQIKLGIIPANINRLIDDSPNESYNPIGRPFVFPVDTIMQLRPFAYNEGYQEIEQMTQTVMPLVLTLRQRGLDIMGWSAATTQKQYEYTQAGALIFGLDYLYNGNPIGETLTTRTPLFDWPSLFSIWKTDMPIVFNEGQSIVRRVNNGTIRLFKDKSIELSGLEIPSTLIKWVQNSIPGSTIQDASITPDKLSTYDIERIVALLNSSDESLKIDVTKISVDEGGIGLPINIPASNMVQNVVHAINRKNNVNTKESWLIEDYAIKELSTNKLVGDILKEQMIGQVIQAVNDASNQTVFLNVAKASVIDLSSTGSIQGNTFSGDNITMRQGLFTEAISTSDATISGYLTGHDGEFENLFVQHLEVETLTGLKDLDLTNLTTENLAALVAKIVSLEAENAQIGNLIAGNIETGQINSQLITAMNSMVDLQITNTAIFGDSVIDSASIKSLDASKLTAGSIDTDQVTLSSKDGHLVIESDNMRIYDDVDNQGLRRLRTALGYVGDLVLIDEINLEELKRQLLNLERDLARAPENEQALLETQIAGLELEITQLQTKIENLPEEHEDPLYGLVVMGEDGKTKLFDHTGVYSAGIKANAISNEKLQEDAIDDTVIRAGSITARSIHGETITGDLIAGKTITASEKLVARSISSELIEVDAIDAGHISAGAIETSHLTAGLIDAEHIKSGVIDTSKLTVGFGVNLMRFGFDSFEQEPIGVFRGVAEGTTIARITDEWRYEGKKSLQISGNQTRNIVHLSLPQVDHAIMVIPEQEYILSAFSNTESNSNTGVRIGLHHKDGTYSWSPILNVKPGIRSTRLETIIKIPTGVLRSTVVLSVEATNTIVHFDAIQLEEKDEFVTEAGAFRPTATTVISGDSIETGRIDAKHIHIGSGTVFGNGDIIDITDAGISARSGTGSATLNSSGLVIQGGAFNLKGGIGQQNVEIDGQRGLLIENARNRIDLNAEKGLTLVNKTTNQIILDIDPETGNLRFSGTARFYSENNPEMAWTIEEKIDELDSNSEENKELINKSIRSLETVYVSTDSATIVPGDNLEWTPTPPPARNGEYIWSKTTTTLNDGTALTSAPVSITGSKGDATYSVNLTNNYQGIPTDSFGEHGDYSFAKTSLTVFEGTKDVTALATIETNPTSGITGEWIEDTYQVTNMTTDTGEVEFKIQIGDVVIVKFFNLTKNKQGNDATAYELTTSHNILVREASGLIEPSEIILGSTARTLGRGSRSEPVYFKVYERAEKPVTMDEYTSLSLSGFILPDREYIISDVEHPHVLRYTSERLESSLTYKPNLNILSIHVESYSDAEFSNLLDNQSIMVVSEGKDGEDAYHTEIMSVNGNMFKNGVIDTWLYANVYKGSENITSQINANQFRWKRTSNDPASDALWNDKYSSGVKEIKITTEDIYKQATFTCDIYDN